MNKEELIYWLSYKSDAKIIDATKDGLFLNDPKLQNLFKESFNLKRQYRGDKIYLRGLIELTNICLKDCLYCGIRSSNKMIDRYELSYDSVIKEAKFALDAGYGSVVLQGGERIEGNYVNRVTQLVKEIKKMGLGLTLSLGEQSKEVYREWADAGAIRYLLRIESSTKELYEKIHPNNKIHAFEKRIQALEDLKSCGYFTGTGVMIGLPGQTAEHLADDLLFFRQMQVNMVGMGPYIPHPQTPLFDLISADSAFNETFSNDEKLLLSLKMISLLRHILPNINIASTTALQVLNKEGREYGLLCGANIIMPNLTESNERGKYQLYSGKPGLEDDAESTKNLLLKNLHRYDIPVGWFEEGNPPKKNI